MKINKCRNCSSNNLTKLFSLGKLYLTGKFLKSVKNLRSDYLNLIICKDCKLVQLDRNFNMKYLYNNDYGYRSGINQTMRDHLRSTALRLQKISKVKSKELVLDIASNDGTLLNFYPNNLIKVGVDPLVDKFKKQGLYKNIDFKFSEFFNYNLIKKKKNF